MSKRFDNRRILYILAALIVILVLTFLFKIPGERGTLKDKLVDIDTSRVNKIVINPRISEGKTFEFIKQQGKWKIRQDDIIAEPEKDAVQNILAEVVNIKPKSLEAVDKSKWNEFNLSDSLAIRVTFMNEKGKTLADLMIGKFTYSQAANPYISPNGNGIQGTSFVRLHDDKKIYSVEGFLALSFSGKFNDYRDKTFLKLNKDDITRISFALQSDSSFVLSKKDSLWYAGNNIADSLSVAKYLNSLRYLNGQDIRDNFKPDNNPAFEINIEGNNLLNLTVKCFRSENKSDFILNSSLNPDVYFADKKEGLFDKLFKSENYFLARSPKKKH